MNNCIDIKKDCSMFYHAYDDDAKIINFLLNYHIKNGSIGFPESALTKVINKLDECKIDYKVSNTDIQNSFKNLNRYKEILEKSCKKAEINEKIEIINNKLLNCSKEELESLIDLIIDKLNEK